MVTPTVRPVNAGPGGPGDAAAVNMEMATIFFNIAANATDILRSPERFVQISTG
jgi:hypothetical protein